MPGPVQHQPEGVTCPHGVPAQPVATAVRVRVSTMPVLVVTDQFPVAGCPFQVPVPGGTKPQPCVRIQWSAPAVRVRAMGMPLLTQLSVGIAMSADGIPAGPPVLAGVQPRVRAT